MVRHGPEAPAASTRRASGAARPFRQARVARSWKASEPRTWRTKHRHRSCYPRRRPPASPTRQVAASGIFSYRRSGQPGPGPGLLKNRCSWSNFMELDFQNVFRLVIRQVLDLSASFQPRSGGIIKPGVRTPGIRRRHSFHRQFYSFFEPPKGATSLDAAACFRGWTTCLRCDSSYSTGRCRPHSGAQNPSCPRGSWGFRPRLYDAARSGLGNRGRRRERNRREHPTFRA
jgi:hypothetical protein